MDVDGSRVGFADLLHTLRADAGLSLAGLGAAAHIARGYIHHLEHGRRWPSRTFAKALDRALDADGALLDAWQAGDHPAAMVDPDEFERFERALANPRRVDSTVVGHLARVLAEQRRAEDTLGSRHLLPPVLAQLRVIGDLAREARGRVRVGVLEMAGQYEEFAGWMHQDAMDPAGALRHYDRAMEAAQEIGNHDMITSVLSLKSHLAWSYGDAARAVGLAAAGQREPGATSDAVLALIAQQEARGHALDGDPDATERALDRSAALTYAAAEHPDDAPPWVYFNDPDRLGFQRGVAYIELGRQADAVPLLTSALDGLDGRYERDRARYGAQLALALAGAGDADGAVTVGIRAAVDAAATGSALATRELRRVRAMLRDRGAERQAIELAEHIRALTVGLD
ncbi:MAG: helix-turn-helix domain-containing protein [Pseudonocardiaceae bacterium]